jgi:hypothetical protein
MCRRIGDVKKLLKAWPGPQELSVSDRTKITRTKNFSRVHPAGAETEIRSAVLLGLLGLVVYPILPDRFIDNVQRTAKTELG